MSKTPTPDAELPMLAPCRSLKACAPLRWLKKGWADLKAAPRQSLAFGLIMVALSYAISLAAWLWGNLGLYLGLMSGFVFVGPWLAMTLYAISQRLERGERPSLARSLADCAQSVSATLVFAVILVVVLLIWARAANTLYIFFPQTSNPDWNDLAWFLGIGSAVGALFCLVIFTASAFSLPMLMERKVDAVTAVITSTNAVLRNKPAMALWALIIMAGVLLGIVTAWLAFAVVLPVIGHATWHAYRESIDAEQWPRV
ncbi:DUF2189 domain-containing protein [Wenzhouxiangella limi]|uniref:DUF2189 domain-containing protein n=1 Tax=Wenzhouxiangella limi TaxID=2707351 RepID=A0A845V2Y6_9GAMM|nr:DUF2189 domain-containing protein [Wenzhouxiangella limi]NDY95596.1 DUF2189 domain-containing protein [Wenzhouxiangella limi]